jgi:hypothetical protein
MPKKRNKDKFTIFIDKDLRDKYKEFCEDEGFVASRRIEKFIEKELAKAKQEKDEEEDKSD